MGARKSSSCQAPFTLSRSRNTRRKAHFWLQSQKRVKNVPECTSSLWCQQFLMTLQMRLGDVDKTHVPKMREAHWQKKGVGVTMFVTCRTDHSRKWAALCCWVTNTQKNVEGEWEDPDSHTPGRCSSKMIYCNRFLSIQYTKHCGRKYKQSANAFRAYPKRLLIAHSFSNTLTEVKASRDEVAPK